MEQVMENPELELIKTYAIKVVEQGLPISRETLEQSYYEQVNSSGENESEKVSQKWIDFFWKNLSGVSKRALAHCLTSEQSLVKLASNVLVK